MEPSSRGLTAGTREIIMNKKNKTLFIIILLIIGLALGIRHFWFKPTTHTAKKPLYWVAPMDPNYRRDKPGKSPMGMDLVPVYQQQAGIRITPTVEHNLGIRTATVKRGDLPRLIDTVGYVTADENLIEHVHTYTDGWIKRLLVKTTGEHVKKGQLLLELYSPTLINAQQEYLLAMNTKNTSLINAARKKLTTLGMGEKQIDALSKQKTAFELIKIHAEQDGVVAQLNVREGMYVTPDKILLTLEDLSHIWMIAEVFEQQTQWVKKGEDAIAHLPYLPEKMWQGKVDYIYPHLDAKTHTLRIRLLFDNPQEMLKPNMYANITLLANPKKDILFIPREAVIYSSSGARVVVKDKTGQLQVKSIKVGIESGENIEVLTGLTENETVISSGQFLIDSESNLQAGFSRQQHD